MDYDGSAEDRRAAQRFEDRSDAGAGRRVAVAVILGCVTVAAVVVWLHRSGFL